MAASALPSSSQASSAREQQLARRLLGAFEREFWAGHHDRSRLLAAPLRVLQQALPTGSDGAALLNGVLAALASTSSGTGARQ